MGSPHAPTVWYAHKLRKPAHFERPPEASCGSVGLRSRRHRFVLRGRQERVPPESRTHSADLHFQLATGRAVHVLGQLSAAKEQFNSCSRLMACHIVITVEH
ncbi:hypothetical protein L226DRAFT_248450 [Lentinus tigrinus ALCF2SS1-7]|uniref:Uncharacterized protein n=1 Tax=Lentinus tigrinus ALCF2SS1-6 TaxID=1328759 RepID=A0A5C2SNJ5_9APHY|nr:hypothetical protein L227DRAFT_205032 [Lentinus tigrinus ALCF2SS1-6]RPD79381.1 hypothetical protein L226DRAFT_248450 [Lentinus tigrinus ALCF2SS1-7]